MKTAIIIGATGLVGSHLLELLINDDRFDKIKVFSRRRTGQKSDKIEEVIIDFDKSEEWSSMVQGDFLFSALGTTIKKAGSQKEQYKIDFTFQYKMAEVAAKNGVATYVLISSAGADSKSRIFYSRMKGELEEAIKKLPFKSVTILQPGILDGERKESRPMEKISIMIARGLKYIPGLKKYRPIHAGIVAKAMIQAAISEQTGIRTYALEKVFEPGLI